MQASDPWLSLRIGNISEALQIFERSCDKEPTPSHIMELGVAYLWVRQYERARQHFGKAIEEFPLSMSSFYGMAGTATWCLGNITEAVRQWQDGLESKYADTNGLGVQLPLLLLVACLLRPASFEKSIALELLKEKSQDQRIKEWPGPIVLLMLGQLDGRELRNQFPRDDRVEADDSEWLTGFYEGLLSYRVGKEVELKHVMQNLSDTSNSPWRNHDFFLARMWSAEFFIARHEASRTI